MKQHKGSLQTLKGIGKSIRFVQLCDRWWPIILFTVSCSQRVFTPACTMLNIVSIFAFTEFNYAKLG